MSTIAELELARKCSLEILELPSTLSLVFMGILKPSDDDQSSSFGRTLNGSSIKWPNLDFVGELISHWQKLVNSEMQNILQITGLEPFDGRDSITRAEVAHTYKSAIGPIYSISVGRFDFDLERYDKHLGSYRLFVDKVSGHAMEDQWFDSTFTAIAEINVDASRRNRVEREFNAAIRFVLNTVLETDNYWESFSSQAALAKRLKRSQSTVSRMIHNGSPWIKKIGNGLSAVVEKLRRSDS